MNMEGFSLFAPGRRSSLLLCLAYEAARLVCPERARAFLMRLREGTVLECRPTTDRAEILRVVRLCGIDESEFLRRFDGGAAMSALEDDLRLMGRLGIRQLPAFLVESGERAVLICGVPGFDELVRAVESVRGR